MKKISFTGAIYEAVAEEMKLDSSVVLLGPGVTNIPFVPMPDKKRIIDLPASSPSAVRTALGLAMTGAKVILFLHGENLLKCFEAIVNDAALTDYMYASQYGSNITVVAQTGFMPYRSPQLNTSYEAAFCASPALTVVCPSNPYQAKGLLRGAIEYDRPVLYLYSASCACDTGDVPESYNLKLPLDKAYVARKGKDVTLITYGAVSRISLTAAQKAEEQGISCEVIDLCTLNPPDMQTVLASVKKTGKVIIAHEANTAFGTGAEIAAAICESDMFYYLDRPIKRVCAKNAPLGSAKEVFDAVAVTEKDIFSSICRMAAKEE